METVAPILEVKTGIEGVKAALTATKKIVEEAKLIMADGVTLEDLKELPELIKALAELGLAIRQALPELKDLDAAEMKEIALAVIDLVLEIVAMGGNIPTEGGTKDITAIMDSLALLKELAETIASVLADGKIGLGDIKELPSLFSEANGLFASLKLVGPELKDLDGEEIKQIALGVIDLVVFLFGLLAHGVE